MPINSGRNAGVVELNFHYASEASERSPKEEEPSHCWLGSSFGGSTEGLLGVWLAQRQAALRGVVAAGRGLTSIVYRACRV